MKALAILFRLVFSILVLLAIACYLQVSPTISLGQFCSGINTTALLDQLCGVNYLTISLAIVVVLTILSFTRLLEALWNMLFGASVVLLLGVGLYSICGPGIALPNALYHNELINGFCNSATGYEVPIAITMLIFIAGWVCASASGRVAITAAISFGLWYVLPNSSPMPPTSGHAAQSPLCLKLCTWCKALRGFWPPCRALSS